MKRLLVIQHSYSEFLGGFEQLMEDRHIAFSYCRPFLGDAVPTSALQHDALWILGGPGAIGDPQLSALRQAQLRLIEKFRRARRPVVGFGYGALLVALQCGGSVIDPAGERSGFMQAIATDAGRADPVATALDGQWALLLHRGGVQLPPDVAALACDAQGGWLLARPDPLTYALLFRPEHKPGMLEDMAMEEENWAPENIGALIAEARDRWEATQAITAQVFAALVRALDLMRERHKPPVIALRALKG